MINFNADINVELIFGAIDKEEKKQLGLLAKAAKIMANMTLRLSQIYCPIDTGELRASAKVSKTGPYTYQISYGNEIAWYAMRVHEIAEYYHVPPTRWKYLEQAVNDLGSGASDTLGNLPSYAQIQKMVFAGEDVSTFIAFKADDMLGA